ncbi:MAG: hypothetical protein IAA96_05615 [Spirochaetes bacterium]|uniref:Lipoprotein n=1 Tax=Candidatus Avitreponema avistercoris TaxID=2840705 RepID=A0A9D9EN63_9SPIR|nr:hypothetical protein [Candidatus Avitreponema avistercoris]
MKNLAKIFLPLLALSLLFGACSSDSEGSSAPEYCGEYTATPEFLAALNAAMGENPLITISKMGLTMHESGGFALSGLPVSISGTYTETRANTFHFELDEKSQALAQGAGMAEIFAGILGTSFTYANNTLSAPLGESQASMPCFTKN